MVSGVRNRSMNRRAAIVLTGLAAYLFSCAGAGAAVSAPTMQSADHDVALSFDNTEIAAEYGDGWQLALYADTPMYFLDLDGGGVFPEITGAPGYDVGTYLPTTYHTSVYEPVAYLYGDPDSPQLGVGEYTITATAEGAGWGESNHGHMAVPAHLTISRAPIGMDVRVVEDPNNPENAIVTTQFTGRFVDNFYPSSEPNAPLAPAGTLTIKLTDQDGNVALQRNFERQPTDDVLSTTFYWADAKPGEAYTATAVFDPTSGSAANFDFSEATPFAFTAVEASRPVPTSTAAVAPPSEELPDPGFGLPLWTIIIAAAFIVILGVLTTMFAIRGSRASVTGLPEGETAHVPSL
jgi:hypothetical protein